MKLRILCVAILTVCFAALLCTPLRVASADNLPQNDPNTTLSRGRALLKQGHADQALGYLESALNLFTQSNNSRGVAAAQDALGDLYLVQGQYKVGLDHYQKAYEAFKRQHKGSKRSSGGEQREPGRFNCGHGYGNRRRRGGNGFNANLMLAKSATRITGSAACLRPARLTR
jgi:tetratricopeptide (TPR) repeat protein